MDTLEAELKQLLIDVLNLEDLEAADIDSAAPLFGDGLGLDSIDALELGVAIRRQYGVEFDAESEEVREYFGSISNLAGYIQKSKTQT